MAGLLVVFAAVGINPVRHSDGMDPPPRTDTPVNSPDAQLLETVATGSATYGLHYLAGAKFPHRITRVENGRSITMAGSHLIARKPGHLSAAEWAAVLAGHAMQIQLELDDGWALVGWSERSVEAFLRARTILATDPALAEEVDADYLLTRARLPADPFFKHGLPWNLEFLNASAAWTERTDASAVIVAVVDSGIVWDHPDLAANIHVNAAEIPDNGEDTDGNGFIDDYHGWNFIDDTPDPYDRDGHGTAMASIIGAVGDNGIAMAGIAWRASLLAVKFLDEYGEGFDSDAARSLAYSRMRGARVVNASWGGPAISQYLRRELELLGEAGILLVAAAGNDGKDLNTHPVYPAALAGEHILAVGAHGSAGRRSPFSNHGHGVVELFAPGEDIPALGATGILESVRMVSGTSAAAAHASGAAALVWAHFPDFSRAELIGQVLDARIFHPDSSTPYPLGLANLSRAVTGHSIGAPVFSADARNRIVDSGEDLSVASRVVSEEPLLHIQWFRNGEPLAGGATDTLVITDLTPADSGEYHCEARNRRGSAVFGPFRIHVRPNPPVITRFSDGGMIEPGTAFTLRVEAYCALAAVIQYDWFHNGAQVPGADRSELVLPNFGPDDTGSYTVRLTTRYGSTMSPAVILGAKPRDLLTRGEVRPDVLGSPIYGSGDAHLYRTHDPELYRIATGGGRNWRQFELDGEYAYIGERHGHFYFAGPTLLRTADGVLFDELLFPGAGRWDTHSPFVFNDQYLAGYNYTLPYSSRRLFRVNLDFSGHLALQGLDLQYVRGVGGRFIRAVYGSSRIELSDDLIAWSPADSIVGYFNHASVSGNFGVMLLHASEPWHVSPEGKLTLLEFPDPEGVDSVVSTGLYTDHRDHLFAVRELRMADNPSRKRFALYQWDAGQTAFRLLQVLSLNPATEELPALDTGSVVLWQGDPHLSFLVSRIGSPHLHSNAPNSWLWNTRTGERTLFLAEINPPGLLVMDAFRDRFIAVAGDGIRASADGWTWQRVRDTAFGSPVVPLIAVMDSWILVQAQNHAWRSADGCRWEALVQSHVDAATGELLDHLPTASRLIADSDLVWIVDAARGSASFSSDGETFFRSGLAAAPVAVMTAAGRHWAVSADARVLRSADAVAWETALTLPPEWNSEHPARGWRDGDGALYFLKGAGLAFSRDSGDSWEHRSLPNAPTGAIRRATAIGDLQLLEIAAPSTRRNEAAPVHSFHPDEGWRATPYATAGLAASDHYLLYSGQFWENLPDPHASDTSIRQYRARLAPAAGSRPDAPVLTGDFATVIWGGSAVFDVTTDPLAPAVQAVDYFVDGQAHSSRTGDRAITLTPANPGRLGLQARVAYADGSIGWSDHRTVDCLPATVSLPIATGYKLFYSPEWLLGIADASPQHATLLHLTQDPERWEIGPIEVPHRLMAATVFNGRLIGLGRDDASPPQTEAVYRLFVLDDHGGAWRQVHAFTAHLVTSFIFRELEGRLLLVDSMEVWESPDGEQWEKTQHLSDTPGSYKPGFGWHGRRLYRFSPARMEWLDAGGQWHPVGERHFPFLRDGSLHGRPTHVSEQGITGVMPARMVLHAHNGARRWAVDTRLGPGAIVDGNHAAWVGDMAIVQDQNSQFRLGFAGAGLAVWPYSDSGYHFAIHFWRGLLFAGNLDNAILAYDFEVPPASFDLVHEKGEQHFIRADFRVQSRSLARWNNPMPIPVSLEARPAGGTAWRELGGALAELHLDRDQGIRQSFRVAWPADWESGAYDFRLRFNPTRSVHEIRRDNNDVVVMDFAVNLRPTLSTWTTSGGHILWDHPDPEQLAPGEKLSIRAEADPGYTFIGWASDLAGRRSQRDLLLFGDTRIGAVFLPWCIALVNRQSFPLDASGFYATADSWLYAAHPMWAGTPGGNWIHAILDDNSAYLYDMTLGWFFVPSLHHNVFYGFATSRWLYLPDGDRDKGFHELRQQPSDPPEHQ